MTTFIQLLILFGAAAISLQDYLPNCQPPALPKSSSDQQTLMIFILDHAIEKTDKKFHWYFLKQLVCSVPVSPSIKTFAVDCSSNNTNLLINKDTVYDSSKLMGKLFDGYAKVDDDTDRCAHFQSTLRGLLANPFIKDHPNMHLIVPTLDSTCKIPDFGNTNVVSIDLLVKEDGSRRFLTTGGEGVINADVAVAPVKLTKTTDSLVRMMIDGSGPNVVTATPAASETKLDITEIGVIGGCSMALIFLIVTIALLIVNCKQGRTLRKLKKQAAKNAETSTTGDASPAHHADGEKTGGKKGGPVVEPPPAPRVVYKYGMTREEYDDWCYYTPSERLPICEQLVKAALHRDVYGDPNAPPKPFPPPMHANY